MAVHEPFCSLTANCRSWVILHKVHELVHVSREKLMNLLVRELPFVVYGLFMKTVHELVCDTKQ